MKKRLSPIALALFLAAAAPAARAEELTPLDTSRLMGSPDAPPSVEVEVAYPNLKFVRPLLLTHAGDGTDRVFVVEQDGAINVFPNRPDVERTKIFLDLRGHVLREGNEEGLLGLAFHPRFKENRQFFVYYSARPRSSVIARFLVDPNDPDRALRESEEIVLQFPQPYSNHNGGTVIFGPDGYLYIGLGDGGAGGDPHENGQDLNTLLGKIVRIDVDRKEPGRNYAIPSDNPFAGRPDARGEIWAYGVRNIWRMAFDRLTGTLWAGDVGQDLWEEVDIIKRGGNYGWSLREGKHPFGGKGSGPRPDLIEPVIDYQHSVGKSITGGNVYRGRTVPHLAGAYLYGDWVTGDVWALRWDGQAVTSNVRIASTHVPVSSFGEDRDGETYFMAFDGRVYRFRKVDRGAANASFPRLLSETGLFTSTRDLKPAPGLIPYSVNVPLWSDGAPKDRWLALPRAGSIRFSTLGAWEFPVGTVLVKTFHLGDGARATGAAATAAAKGRRLETRLLVRHEAAWDGYTYVWNDDGIDAEFLDGALTKSYRVETASGPVERSWYFPSRSDCSACHTAAAGFVLGLETRQMNRIQDHGAERENQISRLSSLGAFTVKAPEPATLEAYPEWGSKSAPTEKLARAYLDANCAMCHQPGAPGNARIDLRFHTPLSETLLVGEEPGQGRLGPEGSKIVFPGDPDRSELFRRMATRGAGKMPPIASSVPDREGLEAIGAWIRSLPTEK